MIDSFWWVGAEINCGRYLYLPTDWFPITIFMINSIIHHQPLLLCQIYFFSVICWKSNILTQLYPAECWRSRHCRHNQSMCWGAAASGSTAPPAASSARCPPQWTLPCIWKYIQISLLFCFLVQVWLALDYFMAAVAMVHGISNQMHCLVMLNLNIVLNIDTSYFILCIFTL